MTRGRHGTFVQADIRRTRSKETLEQLGRAAHAFAVRASQLGVDAKEALDAAAAALRELPAARHSA